METIRRVIEEADEVVCAHALARGGAPSLTLLAELKLVKPIRTGVPRCSEHGCRYRGDCRHEATFETGASGRAGMKARLSDDARGIVADPAQLRSRVLGLPLCRFVVAALAEGPCTLFALNTRLLDRCLEEIDREGQVKATAFTRASLGEAIALLDVLGEIRRLPDGATVELVTGTPEAVVANSAQVC